MSGETGATPASEPGPPEEPLDEQLVAEINEVLEGVAESEKDLETVLAERTDDLQRLQAEYANYKKRVDRDRALARQGGVEAVAADLLPVLDSIFAAQDHEELTGGFKLVADELFKLADKYGLVFFGEVGEPFDPTLHEALMQVPADGPVSEPTVTQVMQRGAKLGERVIRPARVGVANPQE